MGEIPTRLRTDDRPANRVGAIQLELIADRTSPRATAKQKRVRLLPWPFPRPKGRRNLPPRRPFTLTRFFSALPLDLDEARSRASPSADLALGIESAAQAGSPHACGTGSTIAGPNPLQVRRYVMKYRGSGPVGTDEYRAPILQVPSIQ